jgi:hypothetical protein
MRGAIHAGDQDETCVLPSLEANAALYPADYLPSNETKVGNIAQFLRMPSRIRVRGSKGMR